MICNWSGQAKRKAVEAVRLGSSDESWNRHGLTIGIFYKKGLEKDKLSTIGFNVLYDL